MTEKTFTVAGTSIVNNKRTYRFSNGKINLRRNMLKHFGHRAIKLMELPEPMTKVQAMAFLQKQGVRASLPTRSKSNKKSQLVVAAEKLVEKGRKISETRARNKAAAGTGTETPVVAVETPVVAVEPIAA
jgi:hypothetical protein